MQTSAYEVRISDWSSDVCSSDLNEITGTVGVVAVASTPTAMGATIARNTFDGAGGSTVIGIVVAGGGATSTEVTANTFEDVGVPVLAAGVPDAAPLRVGDNEATGVSLGVLKLEIGRASCRERGCQYG